MLVETDELLTFLKALADENRLRIIGLLAEHSYTVEGIAAALGLSASTVSHHLSKLAEAGLVSATARSYYNDYHLNRGRLEEMARQMIARPGLPPEAATTPEDAYDRKVLRAFLLPDGQLKAIPAQFKKLQAILRYVVQKFEPGRRYSEREVNQILEAFHEDTARLRRELVNTKMMQRESNGEAYWLAEKPSA